MSLSEPTQPNRIASEDLAEAESLQAWALPEVESDNVVQAEQKRSDNKRSVAGFLIEDVTPEQMQELVEDEVEMVQALPAHELQRITDEAHQQGFEQGQSEGFAQGREAGYNEGKAQGHGEGYAAGQQQAQQELDQELAKLALLAENLIAPIKARQVQVEAILLGLVEEASRAVIKHELNHSDDCIGELIRESLQFLPVNASDIEVFLHPDDFQRFSGKNLLPENSKISIDATLSQGGLRIDAGHSQIDQTLERRIAQVFEQIQQRAHHGDVAEDVDLAESMDQERQQAEPLDPADVAGSATENAAEPTTPATEPPQDSIDPVNGDGVNG